MIKINSEGFHTLDKYIQTQLAVMQPSPLAIMQQTVTLIEEPQTCSDVNANGLQCVECAGDINDCLSTIQVPQHPTPPTSPAVPEVTQPLNTPDPHILAMMQKPIALLKGLYTVVKMPTEERLFIRFEGLTKQSFERLSEIVEAYMKDVDAKYAQRNTRGRSWKGTGHRITGTNTTGPQGSEAISILNETGPSSARTLKFSPFPSNTLNLFKTMRKMRADAYHEHCVVLERQEESFQNNINILPYAEALDFDKKIKDIDIKIDEVNQTIINFRQSEEWANLLNSLESEANMPANLTKYLKEKRWNIEHCTVISTDIALDTAAVKQHIEDEYRKMYEEVDETKLREIEEFENNQMRTRRTLAEQALESLRVEMKTLVERVVASSQRHPESVKADLERLRRKVVSIGLDQLEPTVTQIMGVFDDPERAYEIFGRKDVAGAVDERVDALIASLE